MLTNLKKRFVLITMSIVTFILITIFSGVYLFTAQNEKNFTLNFMKKAVQSDHIIMPPPPMFGENQNMHNQTPFNNSSLYANSFLVTIDESNQISVKALSPYFNLEDQLDQISIFLDLVAEKGTKNGIIKVNGTQVRYLIHDTPINRTIIFTDRTSEIDALNRLLLLCLLIGISIFVALFFVSLFLANWAIKPIAHAWEKQKQFVADASHELKTPLTVIATNTDVVLANPYDLVLDQSKWLNYIKQETDRMTKLVNDLLYLAKIDEDDNLLNKTNFNLSESIINVCLPFESVIFESNSIFDMTIEPNLYFYGDEGKIKQLAIILLDNAIKNTPTNGTIKLLLTHDKVKNKILLSVTNTGPGISEEHQKHIFERFYRADESRVRKTGGYGLGLSIAQSIINQHHGHINVTSSLEGPTTFVASLPIRKT